MKVSILCTLALFAAACGVEGPVGQPVTSGLPGRDGGGDVGTTHCYRAIVVDEGANLGAALNYDVYYFADGSVMASCDVSNGNWAANAVGLYPPPGASTRCEVQLDLEGDRTGGFWTFNMSAPTQAVASYTDPSSLHDEAAAVLDCSQP